MLDDEPQELEPLKVTPPEKPAADAATPAPGKEGMTRRSFLRRAAGKALKYTALTTVGLTGITYLVNDWSPPPEHPPKDYTEHFNRLDLSQPIGVLMVSVDGNKESWLPRKITHAAWHTYVREMNEHYGNNWIPISNATMDELKEFSRQFNAHPKFAGKDLQVHFVANHHQGHFQDKDLAAFLKSVQAKSKRAVIYACGPDPKPYEDSGCDYVVLPRINERLLGPELSFHLSPGYLDLIGLVRNADSPGTVQERLENRGYLEAARDHATHQVWPRVWHFESPPASPDNHGAVIASKKGPHNCR